MGAGGSVPSTVEIARLEGFTEEQIQAYLDAQNADSKVFKGREAQFWRLCKEHPILCVQAAEAEDDSMSPEEKAARAERRRQKMKAQAEKSMKFLAGCSEKEKEQAINQGDMEMYTAEAVTRREELRDDRAVNRLLDLWWAAAVRYFDADKNESLDVDEYSKFYANLFNLVDPDGDMSAAERSAAVFADFEADSAGSRVETGVEMAVAEVAFKNSVFELADTWTSSTDKREYVDFLQRGHDVVYGSWLNDDVLQYPEEWGSVLKGTKAALTPMNHARAVEVVLQIYLNRMDADSSAGGTSTKGRHYGSEKSTAELTRMYFEDTYGGAGSKKMAKNFKAFVLALNEANQPETSKLGRHDDWLWLFSRLVGCFTPSGRLTAIPNEGSVFVCQCLHEFQPMLADCRAKIALASKGSAPLVLYSPVQKSMKSPNLKQFVGFMSLSSVLDWFATTRRNKLLRELRSDPFMRAVEKMVKGLAKPWEEVLHADGLSVGNVGPPPVPELAKLVTAADLLCVVTNLFVAVDLTDNDPAPPQVLDDPEAAANREAEMDNDGDGVITLDEVKAHDRDVEI